MKVLIEIVGKAAGTYAAFFVLHTNRIDWS